MWFNKQDQKEIDVDKIVADMIELVKELNKAGLKRLIKGLELSWEAQNEFKNIKTAAEREDEKDLKESKPIDEIEKKLLDSFAETEINE